MRVASSAFESRPSRCSSVTMRLSTSSSSMGRPLTSSSLAQIAGPQAVLSPVRSGCSQRPVLLEPVATVDDDHLTAEIRRCRGGEEPDDGGDLRRRTGAADRRGGTRSELGSGGRSGGGRAARVEGRLGARTRDRADGRPATPVPPPTDADRAAVLENLVRNAIEHARTTVEVRAAATANGVLVEVLKDVTFRLAPATTADALSMLDGIQAHEMLQGVRGGDPVNREALADIIVNVSQLVSDFPEIIELDLNPVFATKKDAIAADVRIVVDFDYKPRPAPRPTEDRFPCPGVEALPGPACPPTAGGSLGCTATTISTYG